MTTTAEYEPLEEKMNVISHAFGLGLSCVFLCSLIIRASLFGNAWHITSFSVFGVSLILLYAASTFYHGAKKPSTRKKMKVLDHAAIYILIAGTYTPFTLITLKGTVGWAVFGISWALALAGVTLKLFFTGRFNILSTIMYVIMGWLIIFAIKPLAANFSNGGLFWLFAGGGAYTLGAVFYSIRSIKFNHAIFHLLVLLGSACHFVSVFFFVLPANHT